MIQFPDQTPLFRWTHSLRSRYSETDKMGYVYYGRYLEYFEVARTEMIRHLGLPYSEMERQGVMLPVAEAELSYKSPIHYDEEMEIEVTIYDLPQVRLVTWYRVKTGRQDRPHVEGRVSLAFVDMESRRPCRAPDPFLKHLASANG
ncbi:MAG: thioesterase family protein [Balneolaceae bacterium]